MTSSPDIGSSHFPTTLWSMVLKAACSGTPTATDAMARLCEAYWYPIYAYIRRRSFDSESARDLTQEFFARVIEKDYLGSVSREKGRFRSFLLASAGHFLSNERDRATAQKRGGGCSILQLELEGAEGRYELEPADIITPENIYHRRWALTLLDRTLQRLRTESKHPHFDRLQPLVTGESERGEYSQAAAALGLSEGALKVAVHRLRKKYREILRSEILATVATPEEVDDEIRFLLIALSGSGAGGVEDKL